MGDFESFRKTPYDTCPRVYYLCKGRMDRLSSDFESHLDSEITFRQRLAMKDAIGKLACGDRLKLNRDGHMVFDENISLGVNKDMVSDVLTNLGWL